MSTLSGCACIASRMSAWATMRVKSISPMPSGCSVCGAASVRIKSSGIAMVKSSSPSCTIRLEKKSTGMETVSSSVERGRSFFTAAVGAPQKIQYLVPSFSWLPHRIQYMLLPPFWLSYFLRLYPILQNMTSFAVRFVLLHTIWHTHTHFMYVCTIKEPRTACRLSGVPVLKHEKGGLSWKRADPLPCASYLTHKREEIQLA